jgi:hypothetical protein
MTGSANQIFAFWTGYVVEQAVCWLLGAKQRLARPRNVLMLLLVASAFASTFVDAQPAAASGLDAGSIVPRISEAVDSALNRLGEGTLNGMGATISAFFLVALMVWTSLKTMAGGKGLGDLIGEWVPIWVSFAFVYAFLNQAGAAAITGTMDAIATAIGGANMSTLSSAIDVVARPVLSAILEVSNMPLVSDAELFSPGTWVPALAANLGTLITKLITVVFLLVAAVAGMATVIMSFISLKLVLFLAPVMVPFIMFKPMTWLFDSWLKFLLGACMMKIVLAFMLLAAQAILGAMALVQAEMAAAAANVDPTAAAVADLFVHAMMMIFALLSTLLLMQVPAIATGLLSGGAGGTGFGGIKGLTQSPSARTANDTGEFAAKKGWSGVKKGAGAGEGAYSGYKAGRSLSHSDPGDRKGGQRDAYEAMYNRARAGTHGPMVPKGR